VTDIVGREPIAIIGIGCRFPGGVSDPASYWRALCDGIDAITAIPPDRFDAAALFREGAPAPGRIATRWGGFLDGIDEIDAAFFGISPREAERLDPQQRLLLETGWEALEDAGQPADRLAGSRTGVFVGLWLNDFESRLFTDPAVDFHMTTGSGRYAASGRISYVLGLSGPSMTVDTACSSSLVAVHLACRSLWSGECPIALAGGANVILQPHVTIAYSQSGMMANDGRCKFGDARANGYVRSEGAAVVVLKPLSQAVADGDRVYAVILGSAVNNDGRSGDYMTTPAQRGQEQMLRLAYEDAGIPPGRVSYVEAHGTGTGAGDPVEIGALGAVLAHGRPAGQRCAVGSVKTNFGHTEGAAGVAGLIKAALVLQHREAPPSLHLQQPNPAIPWADLPLFIPIQRTALSAGAAAAYAGVRSFGIAGTNAHVVLGEAPAPESLLPRLGLADASIEPRATGAGRSAAAGAPRIVPLSARSEAALRARAGQLAARLREPDAPSLDDVAYTAARRRMHDQHRIAVLCCDGTQLIERLESFASGTAAVGVVAGVAADVAQSSGYASAAGDPHSPRTVFVFPGQGSQWPGMGRQLLKHEPVFRRALEECEAAMQPFVDWSLLEQLHANEGDGAYQLDRIDVVQPALVALDIALARLWRSWGVEPAAVIGHSMGEAAAACVAGALDLHDAMRVICLRSRLMRRLSGRGSMAVVELSSADAESALAGYRDRVSIAASNSPRSTILSGETTALQAVLDRLERMQVFCRLINVDVASHSPQVDPLQDELLELLEGITPRTPLVPFHSTTLGRRIEGPELTPEYWVRNLRQPVRFGEAVQRLLAEGHDFFLEVSPHPVLLPAIQQTVQQTGAPALTFGSLRREEDEREMLLTTLAGLYVVGHGVDWQQQAKSGRHVDLPKYPWQRERFWFEPRPRPLGGSPHPLLPNLTRAATGTRVWEGLIDTASAPWLAAHRIANEVILPAAVSLEFGLAAAAAMAPGVTRVALDDVRFEQAILPGLDHSAGAHVQVVCETEGARGASLTVFSRQHGTHADAWTRCGIARVVLEPSDPAAASAPVLAQPTEAMGGGDFYRALAERGMEYDEPFRGVIDVLRTANGAVARIALPASIRPDADAYRVHPVLLDSALQLLLATLDDGDAGGAWLPIAIRRLTLHQRPEPGATFAARAVRSESRDLVGDIWLHDAAGHLILSAEGVQFRHLPDRMAQSEPLSGWLYEVEWRREDRKLSVTRASDAMPSAHAAGTRPGAWLLFVDESAFAAALTAELEAHGAECVTVRRGRGDGQLTESSYEIDVADARDYVRLFADLDASRQRVHGVVHLWSTAEPATLDAGGAALEAAQEVGSCSVLYLTQALVNRGSSDVPRLWIVTAGAQSIQGDPQPLAGIAHAPLWGMAAVIANEHPELRCSCVDLGGGTDEVYSLAAELLNDDAEDRLALRGVARHVARLVRAQLPERDTAARAVDVRSIAAPYRLATRGAGVLDNLHFAAMPRRRPARGEVAIDVKAVGLNFMNAMSALGTYPGYPDGVGPLGIECAGVVSELGHNVAGFRVGDAVVAFAFDCFATHAVADARLVAAVPPGMSFEQAAAIPIAYLTASYALERLGRLEAGERVLIHSAAGGVGLAAIQVARRTGAVIFATAGTEAKRAYLRSLGIRHVFDSRSDFAKHVLDATHGEGVDVVLNSLAGDAIVQGLSVLRPYGRFLELGKSDIYAGSRISLDPFRNQLAYFAIDLDRAAHDRPELVGQLLRQALEDVGAGALAPLPARVFATTQVVDAFHSLARGQEVGKAVVRIESQVQMPGRAAVARPDASYLITGGYGALGLAVARWLAAEGARNIVLVGRSAPSPAGRDAIAELESMGATVVSEIADVARAADVERVMQQLDSLLPPLRGVIHAAGLLADGTLLHLDRDRFAQVMAPKIHGAWHLHRATSDRALDFFVLFSSAAATLGIPGQANYAAANAFLDALAQLRRAQGLPAHSVAWGPWSTIGLAAERHDRGRRLHGQGMHSLDPERCLDVLAEFLREATPPHLVVARLDVERWTAAHPAAASSPLLSLLLSSPRRMGQPASPGDAAEATILQTALAANGQNRAHMLETHLRHRAAQVLRLATEHVALNQPLKAMGMDSLMSLELRNRLEADLGMPLSATLIWNYPTVSALARHLANALGAPAQAGEHDAPAAPVEQSVAVVDIDAGQVESLLERELHTIDQLLKGS
jgi:phthiocerol/phenolphthiocerol synthesis type-I polyketide synthase C